MQRISRFLLTAFVFFALWPAMRAEAQTNVRITPDCLLSFTLSATGVSAALDNRAAVSPTQTAPCYSWTVSYYGVNGFAGGVVTFQDAPDANGIPGTWQTFAGSVIAPGTNPLTATTGGGQASFTGYFPWLRISAALTGVGTIKGTIQGWKQQGAKIGGGGGGGGTGDVTGPGSSVTGDIATYADTTGKLLADGGPVPTGTVTNIATACGIKGGPITGSGTVSGSETVDPQNGAGAFAIPNADCGKLIARNQSGAVLDTIAAPGASFVSGWYVDYECMGAGGCTITPTASTIDGAASLALAQNQGVRVVSNGTNYFTQRGIGGSSPNAVTHSGTSTAGHIAIFQNGTGSVIYDAGYNTTPGAVPATDTGTANAYASGNTGSGFTDGILVLLKTLHANTGASTYFYYGSSALPIVNQSAAALTGGEIPVGYVLLQYELANTRWILLDALPPNSSGLRILLPGTAAKCQQGTIAGAGFNYQSTAAPTPICDPDATQAYLDFTASTAQTIYDNFELPSDWAGTMKLVLSGFSTSTNAPTINAYLACIGTSAATTSPTYGSAQPISFTPGASSHRTRVSTSLTVTGCAATNVAYLEITITAAAAGDFILQRAQVTE